MRVFTRSKNYIRLVLSFYWLMMCGAYTGQVNGVNFDHFTVREGLPSEQTYNCFCDRDGFLWIGTDAGVSRFDGKTFKNFTINDGLGDNEIHDIYQDHLGRIWFIPFSGKLSYYYKEKIHHQNVNALMEGPAHGITNHVLLAEDAGGNLYLSKTGSRKIIKLCGLRAEPVVYDLSDQIGGGDGFSIFYGNSSGQVFCITTGRQLIVLRGNLAKNVTPAGFLEKEQPTRFYPNRQVYTGYVVFSGKEGIYKLSKDKVSLIIPQEKMPFKKHSDFIQIKFDNLNNLWLNHLDYNTVFYRYSNGRYLEPVRVLDNLFSLTAFDNENNIWFATNDGLYKTTYSKLQDKATFDINHNLVAQKVISCAMDKDSGLWLGYGNGYVSRFKPHAVSHYNLKVKRNASNRVVQIKVNSAGHVLIGTDETVLMARRHKAGQYSYPLHFRNGKGIILSCSSKNIFFDSRDQAYVSDPFAVYLLHSNKKMLQAEEKVRDTSMTRTRIFSCFFDKQDRFYISTIDGFQVYEKDRFLQLAGQNEWLKIRIQDYAESSNGTIFLAAYNNGLLAMKDKQILGTMPRFNGQTLICRRIYLKNDTLYVATNGGIGILTFTNGKFTLIKLYSASDGLVSSDVNDLAFLGNRLFAATSHGVSSFNMELRPMDHSPAPRLVLQSIHVGDSAYTVNQPLRLSHDAKLIRITFIAPVLDKPELTRYRYRFSTADEWQITSANFIEFGKLKPGSYDISIQAKKYNSPWSAPKTIRFMIRPPFYTTLWFTCLVILAAAAGLSFMIKFSLDRKFRNQLYALQKKEAIEQERNRIAADLHDDIGAELTNIAILSRVLKFTTPSDKEESLKIVTKIETSSNQVITKMNDVIWTLRAGNHSLKSLASHVRNYVASLNEHTPAAIHIDISDSMMTGLPLHAAFTRNVFLVIKELLQNAAKHSGATCITLRLYLSGLYVLHIDYHDNGVGFDIAGVKHGQGLSNIRRRVADNKGAVDISSAIDQGCRIKITIPIII